MIETFPYEEQYYLAYADYGDKTGYPVLVHHGLIGSIEQPDFNQELEGRQVRMIFIARPGYGASSLYPMANYADWANIISAFVEALGFTHFDVMGMSAGAPYCYALAALMPERVKRVFIYSGLPALHANTVLAQYPNVQEVEKEYDFYRQASLEEIAKSLYDMYLSPLPEDVLATQDFQDAMANQGLGMAREAKLQSLSWGFEMHDVAQHVLMQHGEQDAEVPFAAAQKTAELLRNCTLHGLEDAPHVSDETLQIFLETMIRQIHEQERT